MIQFTHRRTEPSALIPQLGIFGVRDYNRQHSLVNVDSAKLYGRSMYSPLA